MWPGVPGKGACECWLEHTWMMLTIAGFVCVVGMLQKGGAVFMVGKVTNKDVLDLQKEAQELSECSWSWATAEGRVQPLGMEGALCTWVRARVEGELCGAARAPCLVGRGGRRKGRTTEEVDDGGLLCWVEGWDC